MAPKKEITGLSLKLLIDRESNRVMFAEAGKDTVDFLFSLLQMPVASIIRLLTANNMVGSIGNISKSIENLDNDYIKSNKCKDVLLKPCIQSTPLSQTADLLTLGDYSAASAETNKLLYRCHYHVGLQYTSCNYYTERMNDPCPKCNRPMATAMIPMPSSSDVGRVKGGEDVKAGVGFVKELVVYMVMDDLTISPMSTISGLTQLNKFGVKDIGSLEERRVSMGMEEGLALLKASLESKAVLTDVFLSKNKKAKNRR